jgi:hypothetical protein
VSRRGRHARSSTPTSSTRACSTNSWVVTHDRGYLRDGLRRHGIEVAAPDVFLDIAFAAQPRGMLEILEPQAATWATGRPIEALLAAIERAGAPVLASKARQALSI